MTMYVTIVSSILLHRLTPDINNGSQPTRAWTRKSKIKDLQHYHERTWEKRNIQAWENKEDRDLLDDLESHG